MSSKGTVHYQTQGEIALLTIDNPPVNLLASGVRKGIEAGLSRAQSDEAVTSVVITGSGPAFIAGADISEFGAAPVEPSLDAVFAMVERCSKPVVAALNGVTLGGGMEIALCCDARVASPRAALGLPEVKLGLLPGGGGTQRLPRLIGAERALALILSGELVPAPKAAALGMVDAIIEGDLIEGALTYAREFVARGAARRVIRHDDSKIANTRGDERVFADAYARAAAVMPGRFALEMIVRSVEAAVNAPDFEAGLAVEAACFQRCVEHPQHGALKHLFFAERSCAKIPGLGPEVRARKIARAVALAGTEAAEFAARLAKAGVEIDTLEANPDLRAHRDTLASAQLLLVDSETKPETLAALAAHLDPEATLAMLVEVDGFEALAEAGGRPARSVGLRSSANGRVLEVVRGRETDDETLATAMALGKLTRSLAVCSRQGHIGARARAAFEAELAALQAEGVSAEALQRCLGRAGVASDEGAEGRSCHLVGATEGVSESESESENDEAILARCLGAWAKEAQLLLGEGVALRAGDVDVVCVHGYGFPELLGGPLYWASMATSTATATRSRQAG